MTLSCTNLIWSTGTETAGNVNSTSTPQTTAISRNRGPATPRSLAALTGWRGHSRPLASTDRQRGQRVSNLRAAAAHHALVAQACIGGAVPKPIHRLDEVRDPSCHGACEVAQIVEAHRRHVP